MGFSIELNDSAGFDIFKADFAFLQGHSFSDLKTRNSQRQFFNVSNTSYFFC